MLLPAAAVLAALLCAAVPGRAAAQVDVEVYDRTDGTTLPVHRRDGRRYVVGEPRHEYALRLRNTSGERVLAVVSVDGVNVITGQTASPQQSGYVLGPWQSATVDGWRKSLDRVAAFYFTPLPDAYATRTGRPGNVGVIGVAVFRERPRPPPATPWLDAPRERASGAAPSSESRVDVPGAPREAENAQRSKSADAAAPEPRLGTGHGRGLDSRVEWTEFERGSDTPDAVVATWYDSRRNLVALGVLPPPRYARRDPEPFPAGFVPDPR